MKILAIDSSGLVASIAVAEDEKLLGEFTVNYKKTHSQTLLPMLHEVAKMIGLDLNTVDAIAVAAGPGSFTGLRIGSATAKGLGLALNKPLISIPTVDGLAYNLAGSSTLVCPLMDARRNQVYTGIYSFEKYQMRIHLEQCAVSIEEIVRRVSEYGREVTFLGDGVGVYKPYIEEHCSVPYTFAPVHLNQQRAAASAALAFGYYRAGKTESAEQHRPDYLRKPQAEREREKTNYDITKMLPEHLVQVVEIEAEAFSTPWSVQGFADALALDYTMFYVACIGRSVAGYCGIYLAADEGEITNVAVSPKYRRFGIAKALVQHTMTQAHARGVHHIILEVRNTNEPAISLYTKLGFCVKGQRKNFYQSPLEDALVMMYEFADK